MDAGDYTLLDQPPLGDGFGATRAVARRDDPATSRVAAASVTDLTNKQAAVLEVMRAALAANGYQLTTGYGDPAFTVGLTDHDIANIYANVQEGHYRAHRPSGSYVDLPNQSVSGLRTRRAELVDRGLVVDSGITRKVRLYGGGVSKPMTVWALA